MIEKSQLTQPRAIINISATDIDQLKILAQTSLESLKNDYTLNNFFANFKGYQTSYGVYLASIEEVITFMSVHEGLHLGYAMAQKRTILSE